MRILITGINGFVGGHLFYFLKKDNEIFGLGNSKNKLLNKENYFLADISNKEEIFNVIKKVKPEIIFHLASISSVKKCKEDPILTKKVNEDGTKYLLDSCIENNLNPKIVLTSSAHVYGIPLKIPIDETHPTKPVSEYGKSKLKQEKICLEYYKKYNLNIVISRSFNHIGPNQSLGFVCSDFAKQIAQIEFNKEKDKEIEVGDLSVKRDFTDVRDIIKAYYLLAKKGISGEIYNIGTGKSHSINEILQILKEKSKVKITVKKREDLFRKQDIPNFKANINKFVKLTNWEPKINLEQSLQDIFDFWRKELKKN